MNFGGINYSDGIINEIGRKVCGISDELLLIRTSTRNYFVICLALFKNRTGGNFVPLIRR